MLAPVIFLASDVRPPRGGGDDALLRLAPETRGGRRPFRRRLRSRAARARWRATALRLGVAGPSLALPLPERPLPARAAAAPAGGARARRARGGDRAGAARAGGGGPRRRRASRVLDFGEVTLAARAGRAGAGVRAPRDGRGRARGAGCWRRRSRSGARAADELGDACRWSLERLVRAAERAGHDAGAAGRGDALAGAEPARGGALADAFAGAPLGLVWDPGRLSVLAALGLAISDERLRALAGGGGARARERRGRHRRPASCPAWASATRASRRSRRGRARPTSSPGGPDATDAEVAAAVRLARCARRARIREILLAAARRGCYVFFEERRRGLAERLRRVPRRATEVVVDRAAPRAFPS